MVTDVLQEPASAWPVRTPTTVDGCVKTISAALSSAEASAAGGNTPSALSLSRSSPARTLAHTMYRADTRMMGRRSLGERVPALGGKQTMFGANASGAGNRRASWSLADSRETS